MGLQFGDCTASRRGLTTANRGICIIRGVTRWRQAEAEFLMLQNPTAASLTCTASNPGTKQSPAPMSVGSAETVAPKFRMQFRWMNIQ